MSGIREGRWVCTYCGAECRGRDESCAGLDGGSGCGAARQPGVRFYLPGESPYLTDPGLIADARSGADWHCDHCGGANKGAIRSHPVRACAHCGQARDAADPATPVRNFGPGQAPQRAEDLLPPRPNRSLSPVPVGRGGRRLHPLLILLPILALLFLGWSLFGPTPPTRMGVVGTHWERSLEVEAFRTLEQEGWDAPSDARIKEREWRVRNWRDVLDHTETRTRQVTEQVQVGSESYGCGTTDLGNGYFQDRTCTRPIYQSRTRSETYQEPIYRREPVYDDWLTWEVDRWIQARTETERGETGHRVWPSPRLGPLEREGVRSETLTLDLVTGDERLDQVPVTDPVWTGALTSREVLVDRNWWGVVRSVSLSSEPEASQ